jgi:formate hydrogenlyase subunit 3/multisubunit Na+/H+ antiporter MnhD subunit
VTDPYAAILICAVIALFGLGAAGRWLPADRLRAAAAVICAAAVIALLLAALTGSATGTNLSAFGIGLDPLNLPPLLITFAAGLAALAFGRGEGAPAVGPLTASWALALLAADALTLMVGLLATSLTIWAIAGRRVDAAAGLLAGLACLALAFDLLIGGGGALSFAALRALPPAGWRAGLVLLTALAGIALQAGWLPALKPPSLPAAAIASVFPAVLTYMLMRVLLDLAGPAQPLAWGVPIILLGIGFGAVGAWRAILAANLSGTLRDASVAQSGLSLIGIGVVAIARAADQPDLAALVLAGTLVQVTAHAGFKMLLTLGALAVRDAAGTEAFASLGGISRGMPLTTACLLAGALSLAALPLSAGFVGPWTLLQSLFAAARLGGAAVQLLLLAAALSVGLIAALLGFAALRLVGVALLGRPRTPRTAGAVDPPPAARAVLLTLAGLTLAAGLWPAALFALAAPAVGALTAAPLGLPQTWWAITPPLDTQGYLPLAITALLGALWAAIMLIRRGLALPSAREAPGWAGGYAPPPAWLPFGDPALQIDATSFSAGLSGTIIRAGGDLARAIEAAAPPGLRPAMAPWPAVLRRYRIAVALAALVLGLLALAVIEAA